MVIGDLRKSDHGRLFGYAMRIHRSRLARIATFGLLVFCVLLLNSFQDFPQNHGWNQKAEIISGIVPPLFPARDFPITGFVANGDQETDCTEAFRRAIEACHAASGGKVIVPAGAWSTGAIHLNSNVHLHLEKNATIRFITDPKKYLPVVYTRFEGIECMNYSPLIYAFEQENIAITGKGVLDGGAKAYVWWDWEGPWDDAKSTPTGWQPGMVDQRKDVAELQRMPEENVSVEQRVFGEGYYLRPSFVQPYRCKNILIQGVAIKNSPMWVIHPVLGRNVTIKQVTIESLSPNNDGCNPESCRDVLIEDCHFNCGDDCIAIKSGRNADGQRINVPCENIVIQRCRMKNGHGGVTIESEISGNFRNIFVEACGMDSPEVDRALRNKTNSLRKGVIENIFLRNIIVGQVKAAAIHMDMFYGKEQRECALVIQNIQVDRMSCRSAPYAYVIKGDKNSLFCSYG